jgi:heme exporter protein D
VNPLVPTSMDVVAALVWWAMALLVVSVLVAFVVRVVRRRRARSGAEPTGVGG